MSYALLRRALPVFEANCKRETVMSDHCPKPESNVLRTIFVVSLQDDVDDVLRDDSGKGH